MTAITAILIELDPILSAAIVHDQTEGLNFDHVLRDVVQVATAATVAGEPLMRFATREAIRRLYG